MPVGFDGREGTGPGGVTDGVDTVVVVVVAGVATVSEVD